MDRFKTKLHILAGMSPVITLFAKTQGRAWLDRLSKVDTIAWRYDGGDGHGRPIFMGKGQELPRRGSRGYTLTVKIVEEPSAIAVTAVFSQYSDKIVPFVQHQGTYASLDQVVAYPSVVLTDEVLDFVRWADKTPQQPSRLRKL